MAKYRRDRINDEVQKEVAVIIREVKDPRVSSAMICVTGAEATPDLKYAKIYYSILGSDADKKKEVSKGLKAAAGYVRRRVAQSLNLRVTPEFSFVLDESVERGAHIASILNTLTFSDDIADEDNDSTQTDGAESDE